MYKDYNIEKILPLLSLDKTRLQTHILNNAISNNEFYQKKIHSLDIIIFFSKERFLGLQLLVMQMVLTICETLPDSLSKTIDRKRIHEFTRK